MLKSLYIMPKRFLQTSAVNLKGHAKWQNIKNIKEANDRTRGIMIQQQMRMLRIAAIEGGSPNPNVNTILRSAIEEAKRRYVPNATIQNLLKKLADAKEKPNDQRYLFEGRLFKKLYIVVSMYPGNYAHAKIQFATIFRKHLIEVVNAKRLFDERGVINVIARDGISVEAMEEECLNDALECGAEDVEVYDTNERQVSFTCDPIEFLKVRHKLSTLGHKVEHSECAFIPNGQLVKLSESELTEYNKVKNKIMDLEGFEEIYDNLDDENA